MSAAHCPAGHPGAGLQSAGRNTGGRAGGCHVEVLATVEQLAKCRRELDALAAQACEPNVFYEAWMLLPALRAFAPARMLVLMVRAADGTLLACVPLRRDRRVRDFWLSRLQLWRHPYCYVCTPLVDRRALPAVVAALLDWVQAGHAPAQLLDLHELPAGGPFARALEAELARRRGAWSAYRSRFARALLRPRAGNGGVGGRRRKDLNRLRRRLQRRGMVELAELQPGEDVAPWLGAFLAMEHAGWKGRSGSALACSPTSRQFFVDSATAAHRRGRLWMLALRLDGHPVAMQCNLLAADGAYAFKTAFDEAHADASPGLQLEVLALAHLREHRPDLAWVDSCAKPDHALMNRLWPDRLLVSRHFIGTGWRARAPVRCRHALRMVRHALRTLRAACMPPRRGGQAT